jgi:hypothetical protein
MSVFDDIEHFVGHLVHGDLSGALGDVNQGVHDVLGGGSAAANADVAAAQAAAQAAQAAAIAAKARAQQQSKAYDTQYGTGCCDRFTFNSGFLIDGATGSVWLFDQKSKSFEEVPVVHSKTKQTLIDTLIENRLNIFRSRYESEVLSTVAPAQRVKQLAEFEKVHLVPLRDAAKALRY